jgi:indole-3-glycerol phosphate synthase
LKNSLFLCDLSVSFVASQIPGILERIVEQKRRETALLPSGEVCVDDLKKALAQRRDKRDFAAALRTPPQGEIALIAEIKKASPSAGVIRPDFDPVGIARAYEAGGASCLSVLTDEKFFQGSLDYLRNVRRAVGLPLLRKDFIIDARQILESIEAGADAILLIAAILTDEELAKFHSLATEAGLAALVEVHDPIEFDRALSVGARLIGINNRDLKTFQVDLATTERLASRLAGDSAARESGCLLVAESGIFTAGDVQRLAHCGARAVLVGESLMRKQDVAAAVRELLAPARQSETSRRPAPVEPVASGSRRPAVKSR